MAVAPVAPSAELKSGIMAMLDSTPQLPLEQGEHEIARREKVREFERPAAAKAQARWFARPVTMITTAAAALVIIVGGVTAYNGVSTAQHEAAVSAQVTQITTASDASKITTDVKTGGTATVMWSPSAMQAAVKVDGVKVLPGSKTYELWYIGKDGARPAGTFTTSDGSTITVLSGTMQEGDAIGVSVEPAGGSKAPTEVVAAVTTA
jgi:anti-sigma-K factor RskA